MHAIYLQKRFADNVLGKFLHLCKYYVIGDQVNGRWKLFNCNDINYEDKREKQTLWNIRPLFL